MGGMDDLSELAVGLGAAPAAGRPETPARRRNGCPAATGACWRKHRVLLAPRCPCSLCLQPVHCSSAASAGAAGGVATAHSGSCRANRAL